MMRNKKYTELLFVFHCGFPLRIKSDLKLSLLSVFSLQLLPFNR